MTGGTERIKMQRNKLTINGDPYSIRSFYRWLNEGWKNISLTPTSQKDRWIMHVVDCGEPEHLEFEAKYVVDGLTQKIRRGLRNLAQ
jgi:hypothetical protein